MIRSLSARVFPPVPLDNRVLSRTVAILAAVLPLVAIAPALAGDCGQQVWLISTREAPHCGDLEAGLGQVAYWRLDSQNLCQWLPADAAAFRAGGDPSTPTAIVIHGARTDANAAVEHAWCIYLRLKEYAGDRPFRLVIWAWPADRMARRNRADLQMEVAQADPDAYYLAHCLADMKPGTPVGLIGYSFGVRVASGALELLAGGSVACRSLPPDVLAAWAAGPRPVRAVFLAPAVDADWLMRGRCEGRALSQIERVLVTQNKCDRVLRLYRRLYVRRGPEAMGHSGPICCLPPGSGCEKIEVADVSCSVGRRHDWYRYQAAPAFVQRLAWYTFLVPATDGGAIASR